MAKQWNRRAQTDVKRLSTADASWLAGFIDGEGTITICRAGKQGHHLVILLANTVVDALYYTQSITGVGRVYEVKESPYRLGSLPIYKWEVGNEHALAVLKQIQKYLRVKRLQADSALKWVTHSGPKKIDTIEWKRREALRDQIRALNGRRDGTRG